MLSRKFLLSIGRFPYYERKSIDHLVTFSPTLLSAPDDIRQLRPSTNLLIHPKPTNRFVGNALRTNTQETRYEQTLRKLASNNHSRNSLQTNLSTTTKKCNNYPFLQSYMNILQEHVMMQDNLYHNRRFLFLFFFKL